MHNSHVCACAWLIPGHRFAPFVWNNEYQWQWRKSMTKNYSHDFIYAQIDTIHTPRYKTSRADSTMKCACYSHCYLKVCIIHADAYYCQVQVHPCRIPIDQVGGVESISGIPVELHFGLKERLDGTIHAPLTPCRARCLHVIKSHWNASRWILSAGRSLL